MQSALEEMHPLNGIRNKNHTSHEIYRSLFLSVLADPKS